LKISPNSDIIEEKISGCKTGLNNTQGEKKDEISG